MTATVIGPQGASDLTLVLKQAADLLSTTSGELVLDFSAIQRINAADLSLLEALLDDAQSKNVEIVLRGVNLSVYKVLKLAHVAARVRLEQT